MDSNKKQFFIQFAYPTVSGALHVGHLRSYVPPDIQARFRRLLGEKVFFPLGFHATGIDSIVLFEKIKKNPTIMEDYNIPPEEVSGVNNVFQLEKMLERKITESMLKANLSLDYDTAVSTLDSHYNKFIEWQISKLLEKRYLIKKPYRLPWCRRCDNPVALDAAGADIRVPENVDEIRIVDYNLIKFQSENLVFPIATLRPETLFGVTNLWFNPNAIYVECEAEGENWVLAEDSVEQIKDLGKDVKLKRRISLQSLENILVANPLNGTKVPLIKGDFVAPTEGTGLVMSVPAHDPHDYLYLMKERPDLECRISPVIDIEGMDIPAKVLIYQMGGPEHADLELVKQKLYRMENKGVMNQSTGKYAGINTEEARNQIKQELESAGHLEVISELSTKVYCRCGDRIVIKYIPNQWFVDYSNTEWKESARKCVQKMNIFPKEYKNELNGTIISWLKERPLTRATGLGTVFSYEPGLMIEALADSNVYMAFFPIARRINRGEISAANLNFNFFDYVMLGKGELKEASRKTGVEPDLLQEIKEEFDHIYPLDFNMGGMEHKQVHFPFSIFHHTAIFPEDKWPRGMILNWHVILEGKKMSKSEGHMVFWNKALEEYGVDGARLYIAHGQSPFDNFDWKANIAKEYSKKIGKFEMYVERALGERKGTLSERYFSPEVIDYWLTSRTHHTAQKVESYLKNAETRWAINESFFGMQNDLKWYFLRGGNNTALVKDFVRTQLTLLYPFIPATIENLAQKYYSTENIIEDGSWPKYNPKFIDEKEESLEQMLMDTRNAMNSILVKKSKNQNNPTNPSTEVRVYVKVEEEREKIKQGAFLLQESTGTKVVTVRLSSEVKMEDFSDEKAYQRYCKVEYGTPKFQFIK